MNAIGNLVFVLLEAVALLAKAVLEAAYFQDREAAKKTLRFFLISDGSVMCAFGLTLFFDHIG